MKMNKITKGQGIIGKNSIKKTQEVGIIQNIQIKNQINKSNVAHVGPLIKSMPLLFKTLFPHYKNNGCLNVRIAPMNQKSQRGSVVECKTFTRNGNQLWRNKDGAFLVMRQVANHLRLNRKWNKGWERKDIDLRMITQEHKID